MQFIHNLHGLKTLVSSGTGVGGPMYKATTSFPVQES